MAAMAGVTVPAQATEAPQTVSATDDRARLMRMLKEMELPPVVSYNQAPAIPPLTNYSQSPPPLTGMPMILRQHDVEETSREK